MQLTHNEYEVVLKVSYLTDYRRIEQEGVLSFSLYLLRIIKMTFDMPQC
jgi:hypothetical protein